MNGLLINMSITIQFMARAEQIARTKHEWRENALQISILILAALRASIHRKILWHIRGQNELNTHTVAA